MQWRIRSGKPSAWRTAHALSVSALQKAIGSEAALISTNPWRYDAGVHEMNGYGVSGRLFPIKISDDQLVEILPTGWNSTFQTVTLTGKRIKEIAQEGFDKGGMELDDNTTYTIPICGAVKAVFEEGNVQDSGVVGLEAAAEYFSQFETLSAKDIIWE